MSAAALLRRTPREVYRVYAEDEYLAGADALRPGVPVHPAGTLHRLRRVTSAAMLLGVCGACGGVLILNGLSPAQGSPRRLGAGVRATRARLVAMSRLHPRGRLDRSTASRPARALPKPTRVRHPRTPPTAPMGAARSGAPRDVSAAPRQPLARPQVSAAVAAPTPAPAPAQHGEFGFER